MSKLFKKILLSVTVGFVVVVLNTYLVYAKSLKKGEEFYEVESGKATGSIIRIVSSDEIEIEWRKENGEKFIIPGKYSIDGDRMRVVATALGTPLVFYCKITADGLMEEESVTSYYTKTALATLEEKGRFKDNGNATVTDRATKLMWQQREGGEMNWGSAIAYCENLSLAGYNDWLLPNKEELESIIDVDVEKNAPKIDKTNFPNATASKYWSSTTPNIAVDFKDGGAATYNKDYSCYVRCVRSER